MKTSISFRRLVAALALTVSLSSVPALQAITVYTTSITTPNQLIMPPASWPITGNNPTIGTFDFSSQLPTPAARMAALPTFQGLWFTLTAFNLDTVAPAGSSSDYNNLNLKLNGFDTGIKLNDFQNGFTTNAILGNYFANSSSILTTFYATGQLTASIYDMNGSTNFANTFALVGSDAYLTISEVGIPFTPAHSLGFLLVGIGALIRRFSSVKRLLGFA